MKHHIRRDGVVISMDFELGSGCYDKHGAEIFENDKVKVNRYGAERTCHIRYSDNTFWLIPTGKNKAEIGALPVSSDEIEVIGHVEDLK